MRVLRTTLTALFLIAGLALAGPAASQTPPDTKPILGLWTIEVDAGGEIYYLTMEIKLVEGKLAGGLSEQNGMFTNVPLTAIEWDGQVFKCDTKTPTPPDGAERTIKTEVKLVDGKFEGTINIPDMGMIAPIKGVRK